MSSASAELIKTTIIAWFAGGYLIHSAIKRHRQARQIEDTPCSKAASAAQGLSEFQGFAWTLGVGEKNSEGHDYAFYRLELQREESQGSGKNRRKKWVTVFTHEYSEPFYLVDSSGLVEVHLQQAELIISNRRTRLWRSLNETQRNYYLESYFQNQIDGFPPSEGLLGLFSTNYRIVESEVLEGSPIYVKGDFSSASGTPEKIQIPGLEKFYQQICDSTKATFKNLSHLADTNRDGHTSLFEKQSLYVKLARFARSQIKLNSIDGEHWVYGKVSLSKNHKLLFSDAHQNELLEKLKNWNLLRLTIGSVLIVVGVGVWMFRS